MATRTMTAAPEPVSITVRGSVVDSSNRPLANVTIECPGDVECTERFPEVSADGHGHQVQRTDANGLYEIVATSRPGATASGFLMNANGRGYEVQWRQVEWPGPACTWDQPRCALTVDFRLTPASE